MPTHDLDHYARRAESERTARETAERQRDALIAVSVLRRSAGGFLVGLPLEPSPYDGGWCVQVDGLEAGWFLFETRAKGEAALRKAAGLLTPST